MNRILVADFENADINEVWQNLRHLPGFSDVAEKMGLEISPTYAEPRQIVRALERSQGYTVHLAPLSVLQRKKPDAEFKRIEQFLNQWEAPGTGHRFDAPTVVHLQSNLGDPAVLPYPRRVLSINHSLDVIKGRFRPHHVVLGFKQGLVTNWAWIPDESFLKRLDRTDLSKSRFSL